MTLNKKTVIIYLFIGIAPLIIVTILFINFTLGLIQSNALASANYQLQHITEILNSESKNILNIVYDSVADPDLIRSFYDYSRERNTEYMTSKITDKFRYYLSLNEYISECVYVSSNGKYVLEQNYHADGDQTEWRDAEFRTEACLSVLEAGGPAVVASEQISRKYSGEPAYYIGIQVKSSRVIVGEVFFGISKEIFHNSSFVEADTIDDTVPELLQSTQLILANDAGTVIYATDSSLIGTDQTQYEEEYGLKDKNYICTQYRVEQMGCVLNAYCPKNYFFKDVLKIVPWISLFICIYAAVIIYICTVLLRHQKKQITAVAEGIANFHGYEENYYLKKSKNEGINIIVDKFNTMAGHIYSLTRKVELEHKNTEKEMELRRIAEIKTLEAQINPHFLYNTLDTINWMAIENNESEISEMIGALGSLLRYSVTNIDMVVLVKAEIEWIKKYLYLQKKRFGELFQYEIQADPETEYLSIHKMLLQPLVENAVIHGFSDITEGGLIKIIIKSAGHGGLYIEIADNGCGMDRQKIEELYETVYHPEKYKKSNIGFFNVANRLNAYYGDRYKMTIHSQAGRGTQVIIVIKNGESSHEDSGH